LLFAAVSAFAQVPLPFELEGQAAFGAKEFDRCAAIWSRATNEFPKHYGYPLQTARCLLQVGRQAEAERFLTIALKRGFRNCAILPIHNTDFDARCEENAEKWAESLNAEIYLAFREDQADRAGDMSDVDAIRKRDAARLRLAQMAVERKLLKTHEDYYHAAMIFQHGSTPESYQTAMKLAKRASEIRPDFRPALWLYAAATDRYLHSIGKPQIYGTQRPLEPFDRNAISDEERARRGVKID
jgi:tetratricopeptide (TPR) repeat protein